MKDKNKEIKQMAGVLKHGKRVVFMLVNGKMVKRMDKAGFSMLVAIYMLDSLLKIQHKVRVVSNMLMVQHTLEGGNKIYNMDLDMKNGKQEHFTKDIS